MVWCQEQVMKNYKIKAAGLFVTICLLFTELFPSAVRADITDRNGSYNGQGKVVSSRTLEKKVSAGPKKEVYEDFDTKVVGTDGKRYEKVEYLSAGAVSRLNEQLRQTYYDACDEIADDIKNGIDEDAVIAISEDGKLIVSVNIDMKEVFSEDIAAQLMDQSPQEDNEAQRVCASAEAEGSVYPDIVSENTELLKNNGISEDTAIEIPAKSFDLIPSDKNYFRKQLDSTSKEVYDAVVSSAADGSNKTSVSGNISSQTACSAVSAAMNTYIGAFEWSSGSGTLNRSFVTDFFGDTTTTITISSSDYYNSSLEESAQAKVSQLASAAKSYARQNYPNDIPYGVIRYINDWICENNYYEQRGTSSNDHSTELYFNCHSSYGVLLKGYGVCESYAKTFSRVLDEAGIRSLYVIGSAGGGGHAWNYVYLNDSWYLLDSTWNDGGDYSNDKYFLAGASKNSSRYADGTHYANSMDFTFPAIAAEDYTENSEPVPVPTTAPTATPTPVPTVIPTVTPTAVPTAIPTVTPTVTPVVTPTVTPVPTYIPDPSGLTEDSFEFELSGMAMNVGEKAYAKINAYDDRVSSYEMIWESDNTAVAKVNSRGRIKAVNYGEAEISVTIDGITKSLDIYVCRSTLKFENGRSKLREIYWKDDHGKFGEDDRFEIPIYIKTSKNMLDAEELVQAGRVPEISCSNSYADAEITEIADDRLILTISPEAAGIATKIVVRFNGGKAVYIVTSRYSD